MRTGENAAEPPRKEGTPTWQSGLRSSSPYVGVGLQLAGSMVAYVAIGYFLDRWLGTQPWLLLGGAFVGMAAFFVQLVRVVKRMNEDTARRVPGRAYRDVDELDWSDKDEPLWAREPDPWKEDGKTDAEV